jgi:serine O-acetyltransferase
MAELALAPSDREHAHGRGARGSVFRDIAEDLDRYVVLKRRSRLTILLFSPGAQASVLYRFGHRLYAVRRGARFLAPLRVAYLIAARLVEIMTGIQLNPAARIGPGLYIGHFGGVIIGGGVVMGARCNLSQGVTLGLGGRGGRRGSPMLGDRVYVGPGAKVLGPIALGNDVAIGANAVVTRDVPDRGVAVGIPARVISRRGSFEFVRYVGMEHDAGRARSLAERDSGTDAD